LDECLKKVVVYGSDSIQFRGSILNVDQNTDNCNPNGVSKLRVILRKELPQGRPYDFGG